MSVYIPFKFLHVSTITEEGKRKGIPKSNNLREEIIRVKIFWYVETSKAKGWDFANISC